MAVILNEINIKNKIGTALKQKRFQDFAFNAAKTRFIVFKNDLIEDYSNHEVTKELRGGESVNSSFLPKGNIYSFLGFYQGDTPADELQNYLQERIQIINDPNFNNNKNNSLVTYSFPVQYPSLEELKNDEKFATPDNWSNKSWIHLIENGVSNFGAYVYHKYFNTEASRSKTGLQNKNGKKGGKVLGIKWISEIIGNFKKKFVGARR